MGEVCKVRKSVCAFVIDVVVAEVEVGEVCEFCEGVCAFVAELVVTEVEVCEVCEFVRACAPSFPISLS